MTLFYHTRSPPKGTASHVNGRLVAEGSPAGVVSRNGLRLGGGGEGAGFIRHIYDNSPIYVLQ